MSELSFQYNDVDNPFASADLEDGLIDFLFQHLGRFGDPKEQIKSCLDYAMARNGKAGGFVIRAFYQNELVGVTIINYTGMDGYIPANILVYIAVDASYRGKGIGAGIMKEALSKCQGGVALHVEADNPAKRLYERLGFTNKYLEMRHA